ncbi:MAG: hypothetical protein ABSF29_03230 [Tepidisphaeraceae bacterium]|jgi:hypothetical protein
MELELSTGTFTPRRDRRPRLEEPPPVRLVAIEDCRLPASAGLEQELDRFYAGLLRFQRLDDSDQLAYKAENQDLRFQIVEGPVTPREMRTLGIAVPSLAELTQRLNDAEIEFVRLQGLMPGTQSLMVYDPAGNPLEITEFGFAL